MSLPRGLLVRLVVLLLAAGLALGVAASLSGGGLTQAPPAVAPPPPASPVPPPAAWLGIDYNSQASPAHVRDFARRGIVFSREGQLEPDAGQTPQNRAGLGLGLAVAYGAGMVPDLQIDWGASQPHCPTNPSPPFPCQPTGVAATAYARAFVQTARAVLDAYPARPVFFEPLNEPWNWAAPPGTLSGRRAAAQYATMLRQLLPAARRAGIPLRDILVPATGLLKDGTSWIPDLYASQPCLGPGAGTCGPIEGWNVHPYGLPGRSTEGIDSLPGIRRAMRSGQDNIIASEIGFCAADVNGGSRCDANLADVTGSSSQAAAWLSVSLHHAAAMHRAGWLRALLVWERSGTGWAMQLDDGRLTAQGRALDLFAASPAAR